MKSVIISILSLVLLSCNNSNQSKDTIASDFEKNPIDTVLVKIENKLNKSYEVGFYSKSFTYCWIAGPDTLDFKIGMTEHVRDSSVQLRVFHRNPILFSKALDKINESLPLIEQDFNLEKLGYLHFESPIFYKDMTVELSKSYENQFGKKNISYKQLNVFLMNSWLEKKVGTFLNQFTKSTRRYAIEKFHLLEKENYKQYIPNSDLSDYPSFTIHGMGVSVIINE
ncbi:hypothetical protein [Pontibacter fetidus]|uniref:Lipoprotein n=1 Tax=Pontibacter fetidus TaxID=2700082 RepID=A0A6B2H1T5_9BACT|nr:hypothetical protein [Pontibacter fetidus]NDK54287.1 hypothetical protein [Pontibacter fetidus]